MWNSQSFYGKLLDGWEKSETRNAVPYYINHKSERTQWDHPFLSKTLEELAEFDDVRYAAYRTAMKLRFLQKRLKLDLITLPMISRAFDDHGWSSSQDSVITCGELETVIMDIFYKTRRGKPGSLTIEQSTEILLNWLLNMYDIHRTGYVRVISAKIAMVALCSARLAEKYRYLFSQLSDYDNTISRKHLGLFLHDLLQVAELLNECLPFGGMAAIGAAIDSCFSMSRSTTGVEEFSFLDWMLLEPQTLVWLPTMHRMAAAESVKHESKCNICKEYPIIGFRYRCLKCFNYDLCQQCFLTGRVAKKHKLTHPIEEYCLATTSKEDTKAFVKTVRNNLSKRHHKKYKPRYLPIRGDGQPMEEDFTDAVPESDADMHQLLQSAARKLAQAETQAPPRQSSKMLQTDMTTGPKQVTPPKMYNIVPNEQRRELDSIIHHLEDENRDLLLEIERLHNRSMSGNSSSTLTDEQQRVEREKLEARQAILEAHNKQMEKQLTRLRALIEKESTAQRQPPVSTSPSRPTQPKSAVHANPQSQRNIPSFNIQSPEPSYDQLVERLTILAGSQGKPIHVPRFEGPVVRTSQVPPPQYTPQGGGRNMAQPRGLGPEQEQNVPPQRDRFSGLTLPQRQAGAPLREVSQNTMQNVRTPSMLPSNNHDLGLTPWTPGRDFTFGDDTRLSPSYLSLPSASKSRNFPEEEEELEDIIKRLEREYPADMSFSLVNRSQGINDDMLAAANKVGSTMTDFVGQWEEEDC